MKSLDSLIQNRRSIRKYLPDAPPMEFITAILQCSAYAPSPSNIQPVRFVRILSRQTIEQLKQAVEIGRDALLKKAETSVQPKKIRNLIQAYFRFSAFMFDAPALFAIGVIRDAQSFSGKLMEAKVISQDNRGDTDQDISVGLALKGFLLKAHELGLGACILTAPLVFAPQAGTILGLTDIQIKCFVTLGFPDEAPAFIEKKRVADIYREI